MTNQFDEVSEAVIKIKQDGSFISVTVEGNGFCYDLAKDLADSIKNDEQPQKAH